MTRIEFNLAKDNPVQDSVIQRHEKIICNLTIGPTYLDCVPRTNPARRMYVTKAMTEKKNFTKYCERKNYTQDTTSKSLNSAQITRKP